MSHIDKYLERREFFKLLDKLKKAKNKYFELLEEAEQAYEYRYGENPSTINDDYWIDTFHIPAYVNTNTTNTEIEKAAIYSIKMDKEEGGKYRNQ